MEKLELSRELPEAAFWLTLTYASGLELARVKSIAADWCLERGQSLAALFELASQRGAAPLALTVGEWEQIAAAAKRVWEQATWLAQLAGDGVQVVTRADAGYPPALIRWLPVTLQPLLLFLQGDSGVLVEPSAAVIGARGSSEQAISLTYELATLLAEEGLMIVAGLGKGVSQTAFDAALSVEGGQTLAVLPVGMRTFQHMSGVSQKVVAAVEQGRAALLSPFHPQAKFTEAGAVARNKLLVALAGAVFVVVAGEDGVTRTTADEALRMGKAVYVWDVDSTVDPAATGNQSLIQSGALPIAGASEILDAVEGVVATALELLAMGTMPSAAPPPSAPQVKEAEEEVYDPQAVLDLLTQAGRVPEVLARRLRQG